MKKIVFILLLVFVFTCVQAQSSYVGFSAKGAYVTQLGFNDTSVFNSALGGHFGGQVAEDLDLRVGAELIVAGWPGLSLNAAGFYHLELSGETDIYFGAGFDVGAGLSGDTAAPLAGVHGILGFEFKQEAAGYFFELQPFYYAMGLTGVSVKVGGNVYF